MSGGVEIRLPAGVGQGDDQAVLAGWTLDDGEPVVHAGQQAESQVEFPRDRHLVTQVDRAFVDHTSEVSGGDFQDLGQRPKVCGPGLSAEFPTSDGRLADSDPVGDLLLRQAELATSGPHELCEIHGSGAYNDSRQLTSSNTQVRG